MTVITSMAGPSTRFPEKSVVETSSCGQQKDKRVGFFFFPFTPGAALKVSGILAPWELAWHQSLINGGSSSSGNSQQRCNLRKQTAAVLK